MTVIAYKKGLDQELSSHFSSVEFDCNCHYPECNVTYIDEQLVAKLEDKRIQWNKPIHLNCGFRCTRHNEDVKGKIGSMHLVGKAADIVVEGMTPDQVADACETFDGLGRYDTFTHVDVRGHRSRWDER